MKTDTQKPLSIPKILAVDDHDKNLFALEATLSDLDIELVLASSGKQALAEIEKSEFAAILLDVQMPVMDGFETAKRIREHFKAKTTPIIFVTAIHRDDQFAEQAYSLGAVDYLFKPLNPGILRAKVKVFCDLYNKSKEIERHAIERSELALTKELLRTRDEFLSIASHELKTPLTPLNINLQTVYEFFEANRIHEIPREKVLRMLGNSLNQTNRILRPVSSLLDVSQIIEGRFSITRDTMDLSELIQEIYRSFDQEIESYGCELKVETGDNLSGRWDRARLEQALINLLTNALKYGSGRPVEIQAVSEGGNVRVTVRDQGIGIAKRRSRPRLPAIRASNVGKKLWWYWFGTLYRPKDR